MSSRPGGRGRSTRGVTALLVVLVGVLVGAHAALRRASAAVPGPSALVAAAVAQDRRYP